MLKDLLSKLGASTKTTVGVAITPNVGLEMIEIDEASRMIIKYAFRPLEYSSSLREIADYGKLKDGLEEMFAELDIPVTSNIVVSMPNVYFGTITLPVLLPDDAITNAIVSEVEQSYIFKRSEPLVSWSDVSVNSASDSRFIAYSAIQKSAIDSVLEVFDSLGAKVVAIENSYNSLFRALSYLNLSNLQMKDGVTWNLMIVMPNSYAIISMVGKRPVDYFEEPLALKTFQDEEIYNAIKTSAQMTLMGLPAAYLVIVSETDLVSAEILSMKLPFDGTVNFVESNKFSQKEFMPVSLEVIQSNIPMITISSIGVATRQFSDYPLKLNFVQREDAEVEDVTEYPKITLGNSEIELTPDFVRKFAAICAVVILVPLFVVLTVLNNIVYPNANSRLQAAENAINENKDKIQQFKEANNNVSFDIYSVITDNIEKNKAKLTNFRALEYSIPQDLWVTYFETDGDARIDIKGTTGDTQNVYTFYKNLKQIVNNSNIMLKRLELSENALDTMALSYAIGKRYYQFEITDMPRIQSTSSLDDLAQKNSNPEAKRKSLFELGQPWTVTEDENNENGNNNEYNNNNNDNNNVPQGNGQSGLPENLQKIENFQ